MKYHVISNSTLTALAVLILFSCTKPSTSTIEQAVKNATEMTADASAKVKQTSSKAYPQIKLPADADTTNAYWKGIDLSPKAPVLPLTVAEEQASFVLMDGYSMNPVLAEPQIEQPGAISFDGQGRMYVLELRSYMLNADSEGTLEPISGISRWEDLDNDGVYETGGMFVDNLVFPRFVLPYGPNCILSMESNQDIIYKYTDTDNDGKADKKEFFTDDFGRSGNVEHQQASLYWGMDNWLYSTVNPFRIRETENGVIREKTANNNGQWGITHDDDGKIWFQGGASGVPSHFQYPIHLGDYRQNPEASFEKGFRIPYGLPIGTADVQGGMRYVRQPDGSLNSVTGSAGNDIYRGDRLPTSLYNQYFYGEPVARIVRQINDRRIGGMSVLENVYQDQKAEFIRSSDPLFRPVDLTTAPDGTMYITDMYHGIIQEGQWTPKGSYLRTKIEQYQLDKVIGLGRIWRLSHKSEARDRVQPRMFEDSSEELVKHLTHPNGWWRDKAQQLLVLRKDKSVVPILEKLVRSENDLSTRFHALWVLEGLGALESDLVHDMLNDPHYRMRNMAMYVSETLYKAGDTSLANEYLRLSKDENVEVKVRALMTANLLKVPDLLPIAKEALATDTRVGVKLVAKNIIDPPATRYSYFGKSDPKHSEKQKELITQGQKIYKELCSQCHGAEGRGTPVGDQLMAPAFVNNTNLKGHSDYVIKTILRGLTGDIEGKSYEGAIMVPMGADHSDEWVASIASFIRFSFENNSSLVSTEDVARLRLATENQKSVYQYADLKATVPQELQPNDNWLVTASHAVPVRKGGTAKASGALSFEGWNTGVPQTADMWFQIGFPEVYTVTELQFISEEIEQGNWRERLPSIKTHPRQLSIETSIDGEYWLEVFQGTGKSNPNLIRLEKSEAKYLRMKQTGNDKKAPWRMQELIIFGWQGN